MRIRQKMIGSNVLTVLFSVLVVSIPCILIMRNLIKSSTIDTADGRINEGCLDVRLFLEKPTNLVASVVHYEESHDSNRTTIENFLERILRDESEFSELYYASSTPVKDGGYFYSNDHWNPPADYDQTTRAWYKNGLAADGKIAVTTFMDMVTGKPVASASRSLKKDGRTAGVVSIDMKLDYLQSAISAYTVSKSGKSYLLASDGTYVTNEDSSKIMNDDFFSEYKMESFRSRLTEEAFFTLDAGHGMYFGGRVVNEDSGWIFVTIGPVSELYAAITKTSIIISVLALSALAIACIIAYMISVAIVKPVTVVDDSINGIASGDADLTRRIDLHSDDEIGSLVKGFNDFTGKLHSIISGVKNSKNSLSEAGTELERSAQDAGASIEQILANIESMRQQIINQTNSVSQTAGSVNEIASNITSLEHMIENQSSGVTQASAAVEEMIGNISSVNQSVEKMADSFHELQIDAKKGAEKQEGVNQRIEQIESQSVMLEEANKSIANIAEQTNLLAMNAAIEAAHAGESGKGFSVVADEIRKLSETSSQQSKTIGEQLKNIKESINEVVTASADSSAAFKSVSEKISQTDELVLLIKSAMIEQNEGSKQITQALGTMNDSTQEVRNASAEMSEGNKSILEEVRRMQDASTEMRGSMDEMAIGAKKINESGATLNDVSRKMGVAIREIGAQIDQFKV